MNKYEVARVLSSIGLLLELKGESFFKAKAYYDAARTVEMLDEDIETVVYENRLGQLRGFGQALTSKVTELVTTGKMAYYERLQKTVPPGLIEMTKIPGLGAKRIRTIYESLGISTIDELKKACLDNRIASLKNFGRSMQQNILNGIENLDKIKNRFLYVRAEELAADILKDLKDGARVTAEVVGSLRRKTEIVSDIDIIAMLPGDTGSGEILDLFTGHRFVSEVVSTDDFKSSVVLANGMRCDLRMVSDSRYPYALYYFTGSRGHNKAMARLAEQKGLRIDESGLYRGDCRINISDEAEIFDLLGLQYIPPELRENTGEIEAALRSELPELVTGSDIRGILHVHTNYSDGTDSIEKLADYCVKEGYEYIGICDHSKSAHYAGGLSVEDIKRQHEEIDLLNEKYCSCSFRILKGIEVDILPDGSLDYDDDVLEWFDFVIASVHSSFRMDGDKMTRRVLTALENPHVNILGHPTGRLLLAREPYSIDIGAVLKKAAEKNVIIEINANPHRLDLDWRFCRPAKQSGCMFAINPDAHRSEEIDEIRFGLNVARKGWLTARDIVNTLGVREIMGLFREKRGI